MILLALLTRLLYQPALDNQFVDWDDQLYVTENPVILQADQKNAPPVWRTPVALNYHPLTMQSMLASAQRARIKPGQFAPRPFIQVNVWYHALNSALVLLFVWLLTRGNWFVSVASGLFFAVHPMHVESVAWVSERKDVLYTFYFLGSLIAYLRYTDSRNGFWLAGAWALFVLSCLSKAMAVSLVPLLFLIDWYRGRLFNNALVWAEKIPFFAAALLFGLIALDIQKGGNFHGLLVGVEGVKNAIASTDKIFLLEKIQCAAYGMVQYILKFFVPVGLSPLYPYPDEALEHKALPAIYPLSVVVCVALAALCFWSRRRIPALLFGLGFYFFTVVLVSQIISVGVVVMADRYTYIPYIGLALAVLCPIDQYTASNRNLRYAAWGLAAVAALAWAFQTTRQIDIWQNTETLWTAAQQTYPNDVQILGNLGNHYGKTGNLDKAQATFERGIAQKIKNSALYEGLGNVYGFKNDHRKAVEMFTEAINLDPDKGNYYFNRGVAYSNIEPSKGIADFDKALALMPVFRSNDVLTRRAFCYFQIGDFPKAIADYTAVINNNGGTASVYFDRGISKFRYNDKAGAIQDVEAALRIDPGFSQAKNALEQLKQ